jgi:hypothetical protein
MEKGTAKINKKAKIHIRGVITLFVFNKILSVYLSTILRPNQTINVMKIPPAVHIRNLFIPINSPILRIEIP